MTLDSALGANLERMKHDTRDMDGGKDQTGRASKATPDARVAT